MTGMTITCNACQHRNVNHRLWCAECGAPIAASLYRPSTAPDPRYRERRQFYERILQDLNERSSLGGIPKATYDVISTFYQDQVAELDQQIAAQQKAGRLRNLFASAQQAAHNGLFQKATDLLRQGMTEDSAAYPWQEMIEEVSAKNEQRERQLEAMRQAKTLLAEANVCLASARLDEAAEKLRHAAELDPSNRQVTSALTRVKSQIAQQRALQERKEGEAESVVSPADRDQEPVLARLVVESQSVESQSVESQRAEPPSAELQDSRSRRADSKGAKLQAGRAKQIRETFAEDQVEIPSPHRRWIEAASHWSSIIKPFLLDNVGWFVGAFMVVAGFAVLILTFWGTIEQNRILMQSLVFIALAVATAMFFSLAYFMRLKYPQLESSSNALLVIVALLIPLVFAAAMLTSLVPAPSSEVTRIESRGGVLTAIPDLAGPGQAAFVSARKDGVIP